MLALVQHTRLITGLLVAIFFARTAGSSVPSSFALCRVQTNQRHSREIEAEVAHWSAQLKASDHEDRRDAAMRLSRLPGEAALSALITALTDPSPGVRALVLAGLGERSDTSIVPLVVARLTSDRDLFVRKTAAYALGRFSGTERTSALLAALKDKDPELRGAAAVSLGDHADAAAVEQLAAALYDKSAFVRARAAHALGVNGRAAAQAVPALIRLLASDSDGEVKRHAATALGSVGDRSALQALEQASRDSDSYLAQAARDSIRMIEGAK
jgi:HEAT repeat protein